MRIALAEGMARTLGFTQIIVFGHSQESGTVITTWGIDAERSAHAAHGANYIKGLWGWPEDTIVESAKVKALHDRIAELEAQLSSGPSTVHVIEGTEYERGWGCRPDGYVAFTNKADAELYIAEYNKKYNNLPSAPDEYTTYQYIGIKDCSPAFLRLVKQKGSHHFNRKSEMLE